MSWLNTPDGHIAVGLTLVAGGMGALHNGVEYGRDIVVFGLAILSRSMWGAPKS